MAKKVVVSAQWDSVAYPLMSFLPLVLKGGILQRGMLLALFVLLDTSAPSLHLLPHLFGVLMDILLI
jgi:hypothetical protein